MKKIKYLVIGFLLGSIFFSSLAFAASKSIDVNFLPLKYYFDGVQKVPPSDQQGFIYNGRTFVPLSFVCKSVGKDVLWEGKTSSIYVGTIPGKNVDLTSLSYARSSGNNIHIDQWQTYNLDTFKLCDTEHLKGIGSETYSIGTSSITYNLDAKYSKFTASIGIDDADKDNPDTTKGRIKIYDADGKDLYTSDELTVGNKPIDLNLDITGVTQMSIEFIHGSNGYSTSHIVIANPKLFY